MYKNNVSDTEKEMIIINEMDTEQGRAALAESMGVPIRCGGMGYHNQVAYITFGGYPYPERALRAVEQLRDKWGISVAARWMTEYRELNESYRAEYPSLVEPADHWDWVEHKDDPDHFPTYSLWDTKRAIRDWIEVEHLQCGNMQVCTLDDLCDNCTKRAGAKKKLLQAGAIPDVMKPLT